MRCCRPGTGSGPAGRSRCPAVRIGHRAALVGVVDVAVQLDVLNRDLALRADARGGVDVVRLRPPLRVRAIASRGRLDRRVVALGAEVDRACRPPTPTVGNRRWRTGDRACRRPILHGRDGVPNSGPPRPMRASVTFPSSNLAWKRFTPFDSSSTTSSRRRTSPCTPGSGRRPRDGRARSRSRVGSTLPVVGSWSRPAL